MKNVQIILVLALLIRLAVMPFTYHSDIQPFDLAGYLFGKGVGLNFYDFLRVQDQNSKFIRVYPTNLFNYPPVVYFFLGGVDNLTTLPTPASVRERFIFDVSASLGDWRVNLHLFLLKIIYVPFDLGVAWVLWKIVDKKYQVWALGLWLLNPVAIFGIYMMGQFDVIPAFFSLMTVFWLRSRSDKNAIWVATIFLGLGAAFKIYPLLFLPILMSLKMPGWKRIGVFVLGIGIYILTILPFIFSTGFRSTALVAGQITKSLYAQIPISGGESVIIYISALVCAYLIFFRYHTTVGTIANRMMMILFIFFMLTHYHPQWFVWLVPFLILELLENNFRSWLAQIVVYSSWFGSLWFFDSGMTIGMLAPVWPNLYNGASIWQIFRIGVDVNYARSVLASVFFGASLMILILNFGRHIDYKRIQR